MNNAVTEHLELLTTTDTTRSTSGRGQQYQAGTDRYKKMRELILELAVRGKLVPQNSEDELASMLLERIKAEKTRLIAEGEIKRQKSLPEISDAEKPFDLPKGWEWCRLQSITSKITDGDHKTPPRIGSGRRLLSAKNIRDGFLDMENTDFISDEHYQKSRERCCPESGDLLMVSVGGTIGRSSLVSNDDQFALVRRVTLIKPLGFNPEYLKLAMDSTLLQGSVHGNKRGGAQPCLYLSEISKFPFSLPPLAEQHRIVIRVSELMTLCDQLEQEETDSIAAHQTLVDAMPTTLTDSKDASELAENWSLVAEHFDTLFTTEASITRLRQTILQLAVMGRLVPQNPDDEPAVKLLERISAEKDKLTKEGKIKPQKTLPEITTEPFTIPASRAWLNMADCFALVTDGDHQAPPKADSGVPFLVIGNLNTGNASFYGCKYVPKHYYQSIGWGRQPINGDLLYTVTGSYGIPIKVDTDEQFCVQRHVAILKVTKFTPVDYFNDYFKLLLASKYAYD